MIVPDDATPPMALLRLLQLVSPALPIGGYHFSQGLEYAIEAGWVRDEASASAWIEGLARFAVGTLDLPVLVRLHDAWTRSDLESVERWSRFLIASRETAELRAEDRHLGRSLAKLLAANGLSAAQSLAGSLSTSYATAFSLACVHRGIDVSCAVWGYLWAWCESQVLAAIKAAPLGQSAGQRMLERLIEEIPATAGNALRMSDEEIGSAAPLQLVASAAHETQYSRLFRS